jgi:hypothetical protein
MRSGSTRHNINSVRAPPSPLVGFTAAALHYSYQAHYNYLSSIEGMKRKADNGNQTLVKRTRVEDYCNVEPIRDSRGDIIWPAAIEQITTAQAFIKEW